MEWKVYGSRKDYSDDDGGRRGKHVAIEHGNFWARAAGGVWARRDDGKTVYVRRRPGKGRPFYYRVHGEVAPAEPKPPKPPKPPKHMEPLFDLS